MSDFIFVVKCFMYTVLIAFLMQTKVSGISLETRTYNFLRTSQFTSYLQDAADGGARLLQDGFAKAKSFATGSKAHPESIENKASRH